MNILSKFRDYKFLVFKKNDIILSILILIIFGFDRITKQQVLNNFSDKEYYINNFLNIDLLWNIGIGFGLFSSDSTIFYNFMTLLITFVILALFYFFIKSENPDKAAYALILGGAIGNLYDRLIFQAVPDFIDLHYNNFHWFTFNVADIFITIGILIILMTGFFVKK
tara:strand:+ start:4544 stop:5044 length:501 start_codon:yes stop_codon:yes gene_type:complete